MIKINIINIFRKTSVGIDIADHTIEVVELIKRKGKIEVLNINRINLPLGVVSHGRIKDEEKLSLAVSEVLSKAKPKPIFANRVFLGLPENQVYTHIFSIQDGDIDIGKISQIAFEEAQKNIPL